MLYRLAPRQSAPISETGGFAVRLHDDARKMVAFIGHRTADKDGAVTAKFGGTGFFVLHEGFSHFITARHVAEALGGPFIIGINDTKGNLQLCDIDRADWQFHPNENVDVAVILAGLSDDADWVPFPSFGFATPGQQFYDSVGAGDLVYIVGLYRLFPGRGKILPGVHTGHIFMTPDEEIPVKNRQTGKLRNVRGYLVEAQTLEGLSGSPVLVRYTNRTGMLSGGGRVVTYTDSVHLMGLWSGAWDSPAGPTLAEQMGKDARVPVGMGVTVPADQILEVLNLPELRKQRADIQSGKEESRAATMDAAFGDVPATNPEENPSHREDFNRLVGAASKPKPKGDRT